MIYYHKHRFSHFFYKKMQCSVPAISRQTGERWDHISLHRRLEGSSRVEIRVHMDDSDNLNE